ncbi:MAG: hypothetical protein ABEH86_00610 [Haloarcula sp.]
MSVSTYAVLRAVVEAYEAVGEPVSLALIAEWLDTEPSPVEDASDALREYDLLVAVGERYRPTVTAYELLELDVNGEAVLVIDPIEE